MLELKALIDHLPSPPLTKLYGKVLKSFAGEETPVRNKIIQDITEKRNDLFHSVIRRDKVNLQNDVMKKYLVATEIALFHLWLDLYPYDEGVNVRYKKLLDENIKLKLNLVREGYSYSTKIQG